MPIFENKGKRYNIPDEKVSSFRKSFPDAQVYYNNGGKSYKIPVSKADAFVKSFPKASYSSLEQIDGTKPTAPVQAPAAPAAPAPVQGNAQKAEISPDSMKVLREIASGMDLNAERKEPDLMAGIKPTASESTNVVMHNGMKGEDVWKAQEEERKKREEDSSKKDLYQKRYDENLKKIEEYRALQKQSLESAPTEKPKQGFFESLGSANPYPNMQTRGGKVARNYSNAIEALEEENKRIHSYLHDSGLTSGLVNKITDARLWDDSSELQKARDRAKIGEKANSGHALSPDERALVDALNSENMTASELHDELGLDYAIGEGVSSSAPFVLQYVATGGFGGIPKTAGKAAIRTAIRSGMRQKLGDTAVKALGFTATQLGDVAAATLMSNTVQGKQLAANVINKQTGEIIPQYDEGAMEPVVDENGNPLYQTTNEKSFGRSLYEAEAEQIIENYTELLGEHFGFIGKKIGKATAPIVGKVKNLPKLKEVTNLFSKMKMSDGYKAYQNVAKRMKFDGFIGEGMEEEAGIPLNYLFLGEGPENSEEFWQQQKEIWGTTAWMSGFFKIGGMTLSGVSHGLQANEYRKAKKQLHNADNLASFRLTEDRWEPIREQLDGATNEEIIDVADGILADPELQAQERSAIIDYTRKLLFYRGFNMGTVAAENEGLVSPEENEINKAYIEGNNATEPQDMNAAKILLDDASEKAEQVMASLHLYDDSPVDALRFVNENPDLYNEQDRRTVLDYFNAKSRYDGMLDRVADDVDSKIDISNRTIERRTNTDGMIHPVIDQTGKTRYLVSGHLETDEDGNVMRQGSDGSLIVIDEDGNLEMVSADALSSTEQPISAAEEMETAAENIRQEAIATAQHNIDGVVDFVPGSSFSILNESGDEIHVSVAGADEQGNVVTDVGTFAPDALQTMKDNFTRQQILSQQEAEQTEQLEEEEQEAANSYGLGDTVVLDIDGTPVNAEVTKELDDNGNYGIHLEQPIGGKQNILLSPEQIVSMLHHEEAPEVPVASTEAPAAPETPAVDEALPEQPAAPVAAPELPRDKDGNLIYHEVPVEETIADIYADFDTKEAGEFISANLEESQKAVEKITSRPPKMTSNKAKYLSDKKKWNEALTDAQKKLDYWSSVREENKKVTAQDTELSQQETDSDEPFDANEYIASVIGPSIKITPDSFRKETGYGAAEQRSMIGSIASADKGGVSIERAAEIIEESGELTKYGFHGDTNDVRGAIIEVLQDGNPRGYASRRKEERNRVEKEREKQELDTFANEAYHMSGEDFLTYEENFVPNVINKTKGFDEAGYYSQLASDKEKELENGKQEIGGHDSSGEIPVHDKGSEILQEVQPADNEGTSDAAVGRQGSDIHGDSPLHNQDGTEAGHSGTVDGTPVVDEAPVIDEAPVPVEEVVSEEDAAPALQEGEQAPTSGNPDVTVAAAEGEVNTAPTEAQKAAGNYKKGHLKFDGYDISIENPKGSERSGKDKDGKEWHTTMHNTYGYIRGTEGVDGDHIDVYLSDEPSQGDVFVVDQVNDDGSFDEHKVMYGFNSEEEARQAYLSNYQEGWQGLGNITQVSREDFKKWVDSSHRKTKPFAEYSTTKRRKRGGFFSLKEGSAEQPAVDAGQEIQSKFEEEKAKFANDNPKMNNYAAALQQASNVQEAVDALKGNISSLVAEYKDWAGRKYKKNSTGIEVGNDELSSTHTTIGTANERRRQNRMEGALRGIEEIEGYIKTLLERSGVPESEHSKYYDGASVRQEINGSSTEHEPAPVEETPVEETKAQGIEEKTPSQEEETGSYVYRLRLRPFGIGSQPDGGKYVDDGSQFGAVEYDHKLTPEQIDNYSMMPITEAKQLEGKTFAKPFGKFEDIMFHVTSVDENGNVTYETQYKDNKDTETLDYIHFMERLGKKAKEVKQEEKVQEPQEAQPAEKESSYPAGMSNDQTNGLERISRESVAYFKNYFDNWTGEIVTNENSTMNKGKVIETGPAVQLTFDNDGAVSYQTIYGDVDSIKAWIENYASKHGGKKKAPAKKPASKPKKINLKNYVAKKSKERPATNGILYRDGKAYASDGFVLVAIPDSYDKSLEGKVTSVNGEIMDELYPDVELLTKRDYSVSGEVNIPHVKTQISDIIASVEKEYGKKYSKSERLTHSVEFKIGNKTIRVMLDNAERFFSAAESLGAKQIDAYISPHEKSTIVRAKSEQGEVYVVASDNFVFRDPISLHEGSNEPTAMKNVRFSIGTDISQNQSPAEQLTTQTVLTALDKANVPVVVVSEDELKSLGGKAQLSKKQKRLLDAATMERDSILSNPATDTSEQSQPIESSTNDTITDSKDIANVQKELDSLAKSWLNKPNRTKGVISDLTLALGLENENDGPSRYKTFRLGNGELVTFRLSNHNSSVENFDNKGEAEGVSLVISRYNNKNIKNNGIAHVTEHFYSKTELEKAEGNPVSAIISSISDFLNTGRYVDTTGLAQREEVNIPERLAKADGTVYGAAYNGKIYLNQDFINPETPIHEYTHLWANAMQKSNPEGWESVKELLRDTPVWNAVVNDPHYANIKDNEDEVASEALSRISGKQNAARMVAEAREMLDGADVFGKAETIGLLNRMKNALQKFWNWVGKELFNIKKFDSVEEVTDRIMYDLVNGTNLGNTADSKARLHFIGTHGAYNIDQHDKAVNRLENYEVARKMEDAGEDASEIKMATGWERGADGKWRYEIHDFDRFNHVGNMQFILSHPEIDREVELRIKQNKSVFFNTEPLTEEEEKELEQVSAIAKQFDTRIPQGDVHNRKLLDFVQDDELFAAYPYMKHTLVTLAELDSDTGGYVHSIDNLGWKEIVINKSLYDEAQGMSVAAQRRLESIFLHEVQHLIQAEEGFARGSSASYFEKQNEIAGPTAFDRFIYDFDKFVLPGEVKYRNIGELLHDESYQDFIDTLDKGNIDELRRIYDSMDENAFMRNYNYSVNAGKDALISPYEKYRMTAGEVEARNVQTRMDMEMDDRRESLAEETEDIAREDQIFMANAYGEYSEMAPASSDKTLVGVHNISDDKLRKALKLGGLANPSVAVINSDTQKHEDFGGISLILPSKMIDGQKTYTSDAWTPTYPNVVNVFTEKGAKKLYDKVDKVVTEKELNRQARLYLRNFIEDGSTPDLKYMFLKEKGYDIPIVTKKYKKMDIEYPDFLNMIGAKEDMSTAEMYDAYNQLPKETRDEVTKWVHASGSKAKLDRINTVLAEGKRKSLIKMWNPDKGLSELGFNTFIKNLKNSGVDTGEVDTYAVDEIVRGHFNEDNLYDEYYRWIDSLADYADAKQKIYLGFDNTGRKKYLPYTLQNVSKVMNKQSDTNAYGNTGFSATRAAIVDQMTTLGQIRSNKDKLITDENYDEKHKALEDQFMTIVKNMADMQKYSDNYFQNLDFANWQLQAALPKAKPLKHLRECGFSVADNSELGKIITDFKEQLVSLPSKYFETKFKRPVLFNEFSAAVVPSSTDDEIKQALKAQGLNVVEYDDNVEGSRQDAFDEAIHHDEGILFRKVEDPSEIMWLENQPHEKAYRAMQVINGKLYPPMAASVHGKLVESRNLGEWEKADERPELAKPVIDEKTGKQKVDRKTGEPVWTFTLNKGGKDATGKDATSVPARYNPYWHSSRSPLNDQFKSAWIRPNLVTVEVEIPSSELTSGYKAERAKDAVGEVEWTSGVVSKKLAKQGNPRRVILSRWDKPVRILSNEEVAQKIADLVLDAGIDIPENVVTPQVRVELEKLGVKIGAPEKGVKKDEQIQEAMERGLLVDNTVTGTSPETVTSPADAVQELAATLNVSPTVIESTKGLKGDKKYAKGWYESKTGNIVVVLPNNRDAEDAKVTLLHEAVAHHGLREMFGEHFNDFLENVFTHASEPVRRKIVDLARKNKYDFHVAIEEYLASLAETTDFENAQQQGWWNKIKQLFFKMLEKVGAKIPALSDNELRYILWRSYQNLKQKSDNSDLFALAQNVSKKYELKVGEYADMEVRKAREADDRSIDSIIAQAKADGTYMKAPNGKPTNLDERQWAQVRTRNFKKWFGDWENDPEHASKVVDENGEPRVLYHGSTTDNIHVFDWNNGNGALSQRGATYFSPYRSVGQNYAGQGQTSSVYAVFLNIRNAKNANDYFEISTLNTEKVEGLRDMGYDGVHYKPTERQLLSEYITAENEEYAVFSPTQIKSATENDGLFDPHDPDIRFRFIGEKGAENLDRAEEATTRLDNLNVARNMEGSGKTASSIKLATGWERGADGKWRYETDDIELSIEQGKSNPENINDAILRLNREAKSLGLKGDEKDSWLENRVMEVMRSNSSSKFYDVAYGNKEDVNMDLIAVLSKESANSLLSEYPQLSQYVVVFTPSNKNKVWNAYYEPSTKRIFIKAFQDLEQVRSTLAHEIQHVIQDFEGFAIGGSLEVGDNIYKKFEAWSWRNELVETRKEHPGVSEMEIEKILLDEYKKNGIEDWIPKDDVRIKGFNLFARGYDNEGYEESFNTVSQHPAIFLNDKSRGRKVYNSLGGEVESRNVQSRLGMTAEQRRASLASETEDVSREDQIFLNNAIYGGASYSMNEKPAGPAASEYNKAVRVPNEGKTVGTYENLGNRLREAYQDSMLSLKRLQEAVANETGSEIEDFENAYTAENRMSSENKAETEAYKRDFMKPLFKEVSKLLSDGKTTLDDVNSYLMAKHGLERNVYMRKKEAKEVADRWEVNTVKKEMEDGYSKEEAEQIAAAGKDEVYQKKLESLQDTDYSGLTELTEVEGEAKNDQFTERAEILVEQFENKHDVTDLWNRINAATKESLRKSYKSGMLSKENYEYIRDMFEYYVPLRGWDNNEAGKEYDYLSNNRMHLSPAVVRMKGRKSKADNVLAFIGFSGESSIIQGNRNLMKQHLLNMAENHPTQLATVSRQWFVLDNASGDWMEVYPEFPEKATPEQVNIMVADFEERMQELKKNGLAKQGKVKLSTGMHIKRAEMPEHIVKVLRNGQELNIYINGSPRAAQAVNGLLNPDNVGNTTVHRWAQAVKHFMARNFTSQNPAFVFSNLARDVIWAGNAVNIKENKPYRRQYKSNVRKILLTWKTIPLLRKFENGTLDESNEFERYFKEFLMHGGETGFTAVNTVENYKRDIKRYVEEAQKGVKLPKKAWRKFWDGVEFINRSVEDVSRFAVYMTSRQMGRTVERSIWDAKEITVNFNKKGSGDFGARYLNFAYVFFNAAVQSVANFAKLAYNHPAGMGKTVGKFVAYGMMLPAYSIVASMMMGGDDDKDAYFDLPKWVRENNLVIYVPFSDRTFITIPLPHELRPYYAIGENALCTLMGKEEPLDAVQNAALSFTSMFPLDLTGHGGNELLNFTPTAVLPLAEIAANEDFFGKPIYRDTPFNKLNPEWTRAYKGTSPYLVQGTKVLNSLGGGNNVDKGYWATDINPAKIEHLFEGYLGGMGKFINRTANFVSMAWDEDARMMRNVPIASSFVQDADPRFAGSTANNTYYGRKEELDEMQHRASGYKDELKKAYAHGEQEEYEKYSEMLQTFYEANGKRFGIIKSYSNSIDKLRRAKEYLGKEEQEKIDKQITKLQKELEDELEKLEAE